MDNMLLESRPGNLTVGKGRKVSILGAAYAAFGGKLNDV